MLITPYPKYPFEFRVWHSGPWRSLEIHREIVDLVSAQNWVSEVILCNFYAWESKKTLLGLMTDPSLSPLGTEKAELVCCKSTWNTKECGAWSTRFHYPAFHISLLQLWWLLGLTNKICIFVILHVWFTSKVNSTLIVGTNFVFLLHLIPTFDGIP